MKTVQAKIQIPIDEVVKLLEKRIPVDRQRAMVERLGEACSRATAAKEIECSPQTIARMIEDGRLRTACNGTRVDVRSLCELIESRRK